MNSPLVVFLQPLPREFLGHGDVGRRHFSGEAIAEFGCTERSIRSRRRRLRRKLAERISLSMTGENWVLSEIAFDAKGVALDALHRVMEKAT